MRLITMTAIIALAVAPAAFAQNTMSPAKMPAKSGGMMKNDAKEDAREKKTVSHRRKMHHRRHHKAHRMMAPKADSDMKKDTGKDSMAPKK